MAISPLPFFAVLLLIFNLNVNNGAACEAITLTPGIAPGQSMNNPQPRLEVSKLVGGAYVEGPLPTGLWGGNHIRMVIAERGAELEFDCAFGKIEEPLIADPSGFFEARGFHVFETGGPRSPNAPPRRRLPAIFHGWTDGTQMRLTVVLSDTGREFGPFTLELGRPPQLDKCL